MSSDEEVTDEPSTNGLAKKTSVKANTTVKTHETGGKKRKSGSHDDDDEWLTWYCKVSPEIEDQPSEELLRKRLRHLQWSGNTTKEFLLGTSSWKR